jgi:hypothetical protein
MSHSNVIEICSYNNVALILYHNASRNNPDTYEKIVEDTKNKFITKIKSY